MLVSIVLISLKVAVYMQEIVGGVVKYCDLFAKIKIAKSFFLACLSVIRENLCLRNLSFALLSLFPPTHPPSFPSFPLLLSNSTLSPQLLSPVRCPPKLLLTLGRQQAAGYR